MNYVIFIRRSQALLDLSHFTRVDINGSHKTPARSVSHYPHLEKSHSMRMCESFHIDTPILLKGKNWQFPRKWKIPFPPCVHLNKRWWDWPHKQTSKVVVVVCCWRLLGMKSLRFRVQNVNPTRFNFWCWFKPTIRTFKFRASVLLAIAVLWNQLDKLQCKLFNYIPLLRPNLYFTQIYRVVSFYCLVWFSFY